MNMEEYLSAVTIEGIDDKKTKETLALLFYNVYVGYISILETVMKEVNGVLESEHGLISVNKERKIIVDTMKIVAAKFNKTEYHKWFEFYINPETVRLEASIVSYPNSKISLS